MKTIVWIRNDLRLLDNPALYEASQSGAVIPVYLWVPTEDGEWAPGAASRWWLHHSLARFDESIAKIGGKLILRMGTDSAAELVKLVQETGADRVYWNRRFEPLGRDIDDRVAEKLKRSGIITQEFPGNLLFAPEIVQNKQGRPFQVFTPFWKTLLSLPAPAEPLPIVSQLGEAHIADSVPLEALQLLPTLSWADSFDEYWQPGEQGALAQLKAFSESSVFQYELMRDYPSEQGVSRLSPHLHFGEISAKTVWHETQQSETIHRHPGGGNSYLRQLGWRDFAHHLLWHFPQSANLPLRKEWEQFEWRQDCDQDLAKWQRGETGYPIIDAGMKELWTTGWMHNRVRMIVSSFLVKDLQINWLEGAQWFWDTLVDADLANNSLGWQWSAGCGADAAPYFRIFNPVLQGEKFDASGLYVRRFLQNFDSLSVRWVHQPWRATSRDMEGVGLRLGENYPLPMVDHTQARERALLRYHQFMNHKRSITDK